MNKSELVNTVADKVKNTNDNLSKKDVEKVVMTVFETVTEALEKGDKVSLIGFGTFEVKDCAEKTGRNPKTGEVITIPASKKPKFTAGKALKNAVNNQ